MEILFYFNFDCGKVIAAYFCSWHDSAAAVACSKFVAILWPEMELEQTKVSI